MFRVNKIRNASAVWHLDSTYKLVKHTFIVSIDVHGCGRCIMRLKCSNNDRRNDAYDLLKEATSKHVAPIQVRGDEGSESISIGSHMVALRTTQYKGHIGGRSTDNARIESFWRDHSVRAMTHLKSEFKKIESLG